MDIEAIFNQRKHSALYNTSYPIAPTDWSAYRVADAQLPFEEDKQLSFYVHIPFCNQLCSYCEYSRILCPDEATQTHYLKTELQRFGINNKSKPVSTLLAPHFKLSAMMSPSIDDAKRQMDHVSYANVVGALMYAIVCTRPDISHAVSIVSRYMHNPGKGRQNPRPRH